MKKYKIILFLLSLLTFFSYSQECNEYNNYSKFVNCRHCINSYYKIYMHPKHTSVDIMDTLIYNVAFTGNRDYIISFCADQMYYPLKIRLFEAETMKLLFDNATSDYKESITVRINNTQKIIMELTLLADKSNKEKISKKDVCVGMILQWRKIKLTRVNDL